MYVVGLAMNKTNSVCLCVCSKDKEKLVSWVHEKEKENKQILKNDKRYGILEIPEI